MHVNSQVRISRYPQKEAVPRHAAGSGSNKKNILSRVLVRNHSHVLLDEFLDLSTGDFVFWILDRALLKLVGQAWRTE